MRGFTLIELLVTSVLLIVVLTLTTLIFVSSNRRLRIACFEQNVQNGALRSVDHFTRDIEETKKDKVNVINNSDGTKYIYFPSPRDERGNYSMTANSETEWCSWIVYYLYPDPDTPPYKEKQVSFLGRKQIYQRALDPAPLLSDFNLPGINEKKKAIIVAQGVYDCEWSLQIPLATMRLKTCVKYGTSGCTFDVNRTIEIKDYNEE
ncbi:MAG: PilW family protein [Candidatus Xenobiia bacterium LiM19]